MASWAPNGAGKSTLLRLLNGVYEADTGTIHLFGQTLRKEGSIVRQPIHLVSSDGGFYPGFQVKDLLRYASLLYANWDEQRAKALIEALHCLWGSQLTNSRWA